MFDEAVEGTGHLHQEWGLFGPRVSDRAGPHAMRDLRPEFPASPFQPVVERRQRGDVRHGLPEPMAGVLHILLDLALLPARRGIAELRLEHEVADHRREADIDLPLLAATDLVDRGAHVVVDAALRDAAQDPEGVVVGVEQHLMGLLQIGSQHEDAAVGELEVGYLQFGPLAADDRPVLRPVELKRLARPERQRNEGAATAGLLLSLPGGLPLTGERRHAIVGALIAEGDQIGMQLPDRPLLLAGLARLLSQYVRQLVGVRIKLTCAVRDVETGFNAVGAQILADRVPRQAGAPRYLPDREMLTLPPAADDAQ